jgi:drug/metabolite transporter (DMT)-like permease
MRVLVPRIAPGLALLAALLFGLSAPASKLLVGAVDPWLLAGLLYLGSAVGLVVFRIARCLAGGRPPEAALTWADVPWLAGAIAAGGIAGPVLLMFGLALGSASQSSLLLNLEGVFTALLAWGLFREHFDRRIALGMAAIAAGAVALAWPGAGGLEVDWAALLVTGACLAWAIDNNLTRRVSGGDPVQIAALKGAVAGAVNVAVALGRGAEWPTAALAGAAGVVGLLGYGISLVLFILALRHLGTARTGAYFSTAPFVGAVGAVAALGEPLTLPLGVAGALMAVGVWLHLTERHAHEHVHEALEHAHLHWHDEHHDHAHDDREAVSPREPHSHWHAHAPLRHSHRHFPDLHHRHRHP